MTTANLIDIEIERAAIAGMLAGYRDDMLKPETFALPELNQVCEAILDMDRRGIKANLVTVPAYLRDHGGPDHTFISGLPLDTPVNKSDFEAVVSYHLELFGRRQVYRLHKTTEGELGEASSSIERQVIADQYRERVEEINLMTDRSVQTPTVRELAMSLIDEISAKMAGTIQSRMISTGLPKLDDLLGGGLEPGRMIVIGARPGRGKSALGMDLIYQAAVKQSRRALFFSLEMPAQQVMRRFLAVGSGVPVNIITRPHNRLSQRDLGAIIGTAEKWKEKGDLLSLDCRPNLTVAEIATVAKRHFTKPEIVLVDYLQIVRPDRKRDNRTDEVREISAGFLALKKEMDIPVVLLAQLNRESANSDRRPRPSDLRESGAIEQDADQIILLDWKPDTETNETVDVDLIVAKNRDGAEGIVPAVYRKAQLKFEERAGGY